MRGKRAVVGLAVILGMVGTACGGSDASSGDTTSSTSTEVVDEPSDDLPEVTTAAPTETEEASLTEEDLELTVLGGWDLIWDEDFDSLIKLYTRDCRDQLTPEDFDATLGLGVEALRELDVDFDEIGVEVLVSDFVEGTSGTTTSVLTFPGEEPSDEDASNWVVEDDEWRRSDCDEIAGQGASQLTAGDVGTIEAPAAVGSVFDMDEWRATVVDLRDPAAEGLLASFSEAPPAGDIDLMVTYVAQYFGEEIGTAEPFLVTGLGSAEYESFDSNCALAGDVLAAEGISTIASVLPGQQVVMGACITVPETEVASLVIRLEHAFSFNAPILHFAADGAEAPDPGPRDVPVVDLAAGATSFGETIPLGVDWTFSLVDMVDGVADGLMSEFGEAPPEGSTHVVVIHEATYSGPDELVSDPFAIDLLGAAAYESLTSLCAVDAVAVGAAFGTSDEFEFPQGETYRQATCIAVPLADLPILVVKADNVFDFDAEPVRFAR